MRVVLRWLVEYAWAFYVVCAIGALVYLVRALAAQRERSLALFTLEHETATVRAVKSWVMVFVFVATALVVFIGSSFVGNRVPASPESPLATSTPSSGVVPPTASATSALPASTPAPTLASEVPTSSPTPLPSPTEPPTPAATATPTATTVAAGPLSGGMDVRFGDVGRLVGYEVSSAEVVAGETLVVTLYWQGLEGTSPPDYTVFIHLLSPDGRLIAQHDGPPATPTSSWAAGQTIQDTHRLTFKSEASDYEGSATIMVGLYDPADVSARVETNQGQDYVVLPVNVTVVP